MIDQEKINDFYLRAENIAKTLDNDEALKVIISEIDLCEDGYLNDYILALNNIRNKKVVDWIENNAYRVKNVSETWGHLTAISFFSWERAEKWLTMGRPLSLISLDALIFCTTNGEGLNQSLRLRQIKPRLIDNPKPEIIANRLQNYLIEDNVPRTKAAVQRIVNNIFEVEQ